MPDSDPRWRQPCSDRHIAPNAVHLWRCRYSSDFLLANHGFRHILSEEERCRAERFVHPSDRDRFAYAHGILRLILAGYVQCAPQELVFGSFAAGKPFLAAPKPAAELRFNLSHSGELVLIGVSGGVEIGVDVECMRPVIDMVDIIDRFFSPVERNFLHSVSGPDAEEYFFVCWSLKEAFVKGMGLGLTLPLDSFDILPPGPRAPQIVNVFHKEGRYADWSVMRLFPLPGYTGAAAFRSSLTDLLLFEYHHADSAAT